MPGLTVELKTDPASATQVERGSRISFQIVTTNSGSLPLTGVETSVDLSQALDLTEIEGLVARNGSLELDGTTLRGTTDLAAGENITYSFALSVLKDAAHEGWIRTETQAVGTSLRSEDQTVQA